MRPNAKLLVLCRYGLALLLIQSSLVKAFSPSLFVSELSFLNGNFGNPLSFYGLIVVARVIIGLEMCLGVGLALFRSPKYLAYSVTALLSVYTLYLVLSWWQFGSQMICQCGTAFLSLPVWAGILRNALLLGVSVFLSVGSRANPMGKTPADLKSHNT